MSDLVLATSTLIIRWSSKSISTSIGNSGRLGSQKQLTNFCILIYGIYNLDNLALMMKEKKYSSGKGFFIGFREDHFLTDFGFFGNFHRALLDSASAGGNRSI